MREWMDDQPDYVHLSFRTVVARKDHECGGCRDPIRKGEKYDKRVYLLDGRFEELKTHIVCPAEL